MKQHLRITRRLSPKRGRHRFPRPKTFSSQESATAWATERGFKDFYVENLKSRSSQKKKFRVVVQI